MSNTQQSTEQLLQLIQTELHQVKPEVEQIHAETDLIADLGLDSVQVLEMCTAIEDELDISIPVNKLGDIRTAGQLAGLLQNLLAE